MKLRSVIGDHVDRLTEPSRHAVAADLERVIRGFRRMGVAANRAGVTLGWLFADRPAWHWPTFSPCPQRPFDWEIDS